MVDHQVRYQSTLIRLELTVDFPDPVAPIMLQGFYINGGGVVLR